MADLRAVPWDDFPRNAQPRDRVSNNFRFYELTVSDVADRRGINNALMHASIVHRAVYLCREVMQPIRDEFGPFTPNSVYRCQALERVLKNQPTTWMSESQHTKGEACDLEIVALANGRLAEWVRDNLDFDQLILECFNARNGPNSGWVHVSLLPPGGRPNRRQILSYVMDQRVRRYTYVDGLNETAA